MAACITSSPFPASACGQLRHCGTLVLSSHTADPWRTYRCTAVRRIPSKRDVHGRHGMRVAGSRPLFFFLSPSRSSSQSLVPSPLSGHRHHTSSRRRLRCIPAGGCQRRPSGRARGNLFARLHAGSAAPAHHICSKRHLWSAYLARRRGSTLTLLRGWCTALECPPKYASCSRLTLGSAQCTTLGRCVDYSAAPGNMSGGHGQTE